MTSLQTTSQNKIWPQDYPELFSQCLEKSRAAQLTRGSHVSLLWQCEHGHTWHAPLKSRTIMNSGCPYCSGRRPIPRKTDLATTHPEIAAELVDQSLATKLSHGSTKKVAWRCPQSHIYEATPNHRTSANSGCPYCSNKKILAGYNDLATTHPALVAQLVDQSMATKVSAGSDKKLTWRGSCGHTWTAAVKSRALNNQNCPYCASRKLLIGFNDLATTDPELAKELVDRDVAHQVMRHSKRKVAWQCERGHIWSAQVDSRTNMGSACPYCNPGHTSHTESELFAYIKSILPDTVQIRTHVHNLAPSYEFDIVIDSLRIAFEFNGVYWHSELNKDDKNYHAKKQQAAHEAGYRLIHIWEDDWKTHRAACEALIASKLNRTSAPRIHARICQFTEINGREAKMFMNTYHIQGYVNATHHFALTHNNEPVAVMSVRKPQTNGRFHRHTGDWEIIRYATSAHIPGGFSKLLKHTTDTLTNNHIPLKRWISFSANDISDGNMYKTCGFQLDKELPPDYKYAGNMTGWQRKPKEGFQKKRFRDDDELIYDPSMTEHELAQANGLYCCYDSGKKRWVKAV